MMADDIIVTRMTEADIDGAIVTIQRAFADDPYNNWIFPDKSKFSPARNHHSLSIRCHWGIQHGLFYTARHRTQNPNQVLGCAMWLPPTPPSVPQTWYSYFGLWHLWFRQVLMNMRFLGRGGLNVKRYWIWKAAQAEAQSAIWTSEKGYLFCNIVTVLPEWQGKGVGRALMEAVLDRADEEGVPAYLESSRREPNVAVYERFGFELVREMACVDDDEEGDNKGIMLYCMVREPKPKPKGRKAGDEVEAGGK